MAWKTSSKKSLVQKVNILKHLIVKQKGINLFWWLLNMQVLSDILNKLVKRLGAVLVCLEIHKGGLNRQSQTLSENITKSMAFRGVAPLNCSLQIPLNPYPP